VRGAVRGCSFAHTRTRTAEHTHTPGELRVVRHADVQVDAAALRDQLEIHVCPRCSNVAGVSCWLLVQHAGIQGHRSPSKSGMLSSNSPWSFRCLRDD
jgi:hypothetical protein